MIHSFAITNYLGDRIKLDLREPEVSGFLIKSVTGLGPVKATVNTTEVVTNDGSMFNSARLSQRNIVSKSYLLIQSTEKRSKMYGRNPTNTFRQRKVLKSLSKLITDMYEQAVMWNRMNRTFSARRKGPQSQSFALTHSSIQPERTETM